MNSRTDQILTLYFNSWWFPTVFFLAELAVFSMLKALQGLPLAIVRILLVCLVIAYLGILSASICNLIKKRWVKALVNFVMLGVCAVVTFYVFIFLAALEGKVD
jgi:hypothetical protein